jgi:hypothetical protein
MRRPVFALTILLWLASTVAAAENPRAAGTTDTNLGAARRYVERSDRYLHHSRLRRGMKGYGLTVLAAAEIAKFDVEILSVMTRWGPHQDVILASLSGQNLQETGIIAGMSGSPVFVTDPKDGKEKMIGAVAYGWFAQKGARCGIQPIAQMLAISGVLEPAAPRGEAAEGPSPHADPRQQSAAVEPPQEYLTTVLDPKKRDFAMLAWSQRFGKAGSASNEGPRLVPLATPLMVSGQSGKTLSELERLLRPAGLLPVQSGGVGGVDAELAKSVKLVPGAALAVPLVTGDADYTAMGTVTEVIADRVLALGHSFYAEGKVSYPMGTAYVHAVVPGLLRSVKVGSSLKVTGALDVDETVGIGGKVGKPVSTIPISVDVHHRHNGRRQSFRYHLCKERWFTPVLSRVLVGDSVYGWHDPPLEHTVRHAIRVDYGRFGTYRAENVSSGWGAGAALSDLTRPLYAMANNPFAEPRYPDSVHVEVAVEKGNTYARLLDCKLDGEVYRPGETVTGRVTVELFRRPRRSLAIHFALPEDIAEGGHTLTVCDAGRSLSLLQSEMPHRFHPKTERELFDAIQEVVEPGAGRMYLRLPVQRGAGLALHRSELPDLPESKARILSEAKLLDARAFRRAVVRSLPCEYVIVGSAEAQFEVRDRPTETRLRKGTKDLQE